MSQFMNRSEKFTLTPAEVRVGYLYSRDVNASILFRTGDSELEVTLTYEQYKALSERMQDRLKEWHKYKLNEMKETLAEAEKEAEAS